MDVYTSKKEFIACGHFQIGSIAVRVLSFQLFYDSKTILQEMVQSRQEAPLSYEIIREEGPDHNKSFEVCAKIGDEEVGRGAGRTKKAAEQVAAYNGILKLKAQEAAAEE